MRALPLLLLIVLMCLPHSAGAISMRISNISDFNLGTWNIGDAAIEQSMDICIYGLNVPALLSYGINITSSPNNYRLQSGARFLPYSLYWKDSVIGSSVGTQLSHGVTLANQFNLNVLFANCAGGVNARLTIRISQADMTAAYAGKYDGVITLLLSPN